MTEQEKQNIIEMLRDVYAKIDEVQGPIGSVIESMKTDLFRLEDTYKEKIFELSCAVEEIRSYFDITEEELWGEEDE